MQKTLLPAIALVTVATATEAQEQIDLTVVAGHPPTIAAVEQFIEYFEPTVEQKLAEAGNYTINWNKAWAGTIAKPDGVLEAVEQGLGDVGLVPVLFDAAKLPLENITYMLPFTTDDLDVVIDTVNRMHDEIPAMNEMWGRYNQKFLAGAGLDTYHIITTFPLDSVDDLEGRKIGAPGPAANWINGTGAVPVAGTLNTYYNDMKTGVYDGAIIYGAAGGPFKLHEVAPYFTQIGIGAQYANALTVNLDTWQSLPEEVRGVFEETAKEWSEAVTEATAGRQQRSFEAMKEGGATFSELRTEERERWAGMIDNVAKEWAEDLESRGIPANEAMTFYLDSLRQSGATLARDWDKE